MLSDSVDSYLICTSPRSGSTLLCQMLVQTGYAGHPESYFHRPAVREWLKALDLAPDAGASEKDQLIRALDAARTAGRGSGGPCGIRLQHDSLRFLMQQLATLFPEPPNDAARIKAAFSSTRYIYLHRKDKLAQAISYLRAAQSGLWHRNADGSVYERLPPEGPTGYDYDQIASHMAAAHARDAAWQDWFATQGISPLVLEYDDLSADPGGALATTLRHLGLDPAGARGASPPLARLADDLSRDWAARFTREHAARRAD